MLHGRSVRWKIPHERGLFKVWPVQRSCRGPLGSSKCCVFTSSGPEEGWISRFFLRAGRDNSMHLSCKWLAGFETWPTTAITGGHGEQHKASRGAREDEQR
jgi:hypothetical protein